MWHASYLATIDDWHVGVRSDDQDVTRQLKLLLGDILTESTDPPSGYAIVTTPRVPGTHSQPLAELRHGPQVVLRSRYSGRLAAAAAAHILALAHTSQPVLRLAFSLVARDSVGVLIRPRLLRTPGLEPLLVRAGWDIADAPEIAVTGDDTPVVHAITWSSHRSEVRANTVTLRSVVASDNEVDQRAPCSAVVSYLMRTSSWSLRTPQGHLEAAAQLARVLQIFSFDGEQPRSVADALEQAL